MNGNMYIDFLDFSYVDMQIFRSALLYKELVLSKNFRIEYHEIVRSYRTLMKRTEILYCEESQFKYLLNIE